MKRATGLLLLAACSVQHNVGGLEPDMRGAAADARVFPVPPQIVDDCSADVAQLLMAWIASVPDGLPGQPNVLRFARERCYRVDAGVSAVGRQNLTVDGAGATLDGSHVPFDRAGSHRTMLAFRESSGITVESFTIKGSAPYRTTWEWVGGCRPGADGAPECKAGGFDSRTQWQHGIAFEGGRGLAVRRNTILSVMGDGVELAVATRGCSTTSFCGVRDVVVEENSIRGTGRSAVAVTGGADLRILGNTFADQGLGVINLTAETSQPIMNVLVERNAVHSHARFFVRNDSAACATADPYNPGRTVMAADNVTIRTNVMHVAGVASDPAIAIKPASAACARFGAYVIADNTLARADVSAPPGGNSLVAVTKVGSISIVRNRLVQGAKEAAVTLTDVTGAIQVHLNDAREAPWVYARDGINHGPGVDACGNTDQSGPDQPTRCAP